MSDAFRPFRSPVPAARSAPSVRRPGLRRRAARPAIRVPAPGGALLAWPSGAAPDGAASYDEAAAMIRLDPRRWNAIAAIRPEAGDAEWLEAEIALRLHGFGALCIDLADSRARTGATASLRLVERAAGLCQRSGAALLLAPPETYGPATRTAPSVQRTRRRRRG